MLRPHSQDKSTMLKNTRYENRIEQKHKTALP